MAAKIAASRWPWPIEDGFPFGPDNKLHMSDRIPCSEGSTAHTKVAPRRRHRIRTVHDDVRLLEVPH